MPREFLSPESREINEKTLIRLRRVMDEHELNQTDVSILLDVSRMVVSRWFTHRTQCPANAPDLLRAITSIRSDWRSDLVMKRRE